MPHKKQPKKRKVKVVAWAVVDADCRPMWDSVAQTRAGARSVYSTGRVVKLTGSVTVDRKPTPTEAA